MSIKVGIPRGMFYYDYYPLWKEFFNNLGVEVITSPRTNKNILNKGIETCVDEACLPIKVYHGHVDYLKDKVDYIFIPRLTSIYKKEYNCPKHLGMAEMIKNNIDGLPEIIDSNLNLRESDRNIKKAALVTGRCFEESTKKIYKAFKDAYNKYNKYTEMITAGVIPLNIVEKYDDSSFIRKIKNDSYGRRILLVGHFYNTYDQYINMDLANKLNKTGYDVVTVEMVEEEKSRKYASKLPKRMFWTHGQRIIGGAFSLIEERTVSGVIYISAFGCGLDSVLIDLIERKAKEESMPFTLLTIDEQTGEAGINTRIEAFTDMLEWRDNHEDNIPTYG